MDGDAQWERKLNEALIERDAAIKGLKTRLHEAEQLLEAETAKMYEACRVSRENSRRALEAEQRVTGLEAILADFEHELARDYMDRLTIVNNVPIPLNVAILRLWDRLRAALTPVPRELSDDKEI